MSNPESFIDEVSEEVRRDKLYGLMRRWGWVVVLAILLIVGGAIWSEWSRSKAEAEAQAFGDAVLTALNGEDMAARRAGLDAIEPADPGQAAILAMLRATADLNGDDGDPDAARAHLLALANMPDLRAIYRHVAVLKAVQIGLSNPSVDTTGDGVLLDELTAPGAPFRTLGVELRALSALQNGDRETAVGLLRGLVDDAEATQTLRRRVQQLMVALGVEGGQA